MSLGLYLHIPYCFSKCRYCDFYSRPGERGVPDAYVDALLRELHRFAPDAPLRPDTLYFGGGTPSLLTPAQAKRLIRAADPVPGAEITLEANPETVTEESLRGFRAAGVNRISFGVQSARDTQLRTLGRPHSAKQARAAFAAARHAGFENISGDIMLALPHYTQAEFDETLELIEKGGATHISAYLLKIEHSHGCNCCNSSGFLQSILRSISLLLRSTEYSILHRNERFMKKAVILYVSWALFTHSVLFFQMQILRFLFPSR